MRIVLATLFAMSSLVSVASADVLISEVYYDHVGADDGFEWIELYNTGVTPVDLTGYQIGAGGTDYSYSVTVLSGSIGACETFVIGVNSVPENAAPLIDLVLDFAPDLQNSGSAADGVALFAPGDDPSVACPLDAVLYGPNNDNALLDESCAPAAFADVGDVPSGASIRRTTLAGNWLGEAVPQPNQVQLTDFECGAVDNDASSWSGLKARFED